MFRLPALILLFSFLACISNAQDARFSQYFVLPTWLNPALSGQYDGKFRLSGVYRDQWRGALDQPLSSFGFNADTKFNVQPKSATSDQVSVGLMLLNDRTRINDYNSNHISLSGAYHKVLNKYKESYLSGGVTFGITQFGFNYNDVTFGDQFNGVDGYTNPTDEIRPPNSVAVADLAVGIIYTTKFHPSAKLYIGAAAHHFNEPNKSFFNQLDQFSFPFDVEDGYPMRVTGYVMTAIDASKTTQWTPRIMYLAQGNVTEINMGTSFRKSFYTSRPSALHLGAMVNVADHLESFHLNSVSVLAGFEVSEMIVGLSYEYFLTEIAQTGTFGAFELSVSYVGNFEGEEDFCPKF